MWSVGKFGAVSVSGRADIHPSISQNPTPDLAFSGAIRPFLTGSAPQTEFAVTPSKQRTGKFLTGARKHIRIFEILQISARNLAALIPQSHARFVNFRPFLPGSAQKVERDVTYSKQTTDEFLPGATTASEAHVKSSNIDSKLSEGSAWLRR
jgi:hypothetical protein